MNDEVATVPRPLRRSSRFRARGPGLTQTPTTVLAIERERAHDPKSRRRRARLVKRRARKRQAKVARVYGVEMSDLRAMLRAGDPRRALRLR